MEAVNDDDGIREALLGYVVHGIAEVHCDFLNLGKFLCRYHLDNPRYDLSLCALDNSNNRAFAAMSVLVGEYGVRLFAQLGLIYTATLADVLGEQDPVNGMILLVPILVVTEVMLVVAFYLAALNMKESC